MLVELENLLVVLLLKQEGEEGFEVLGVGLVVGEAVEQGSAAQVGALPERVKLCQ